MIMDRISTGTSALDQMLGGGLFRGTTTLIRGRYGSGKSIIGVHFAHAGIEQDGYPGSIIDIAEGDDQCQIQYAKDFFNWESNGSYHQVGMPRGMTIRDRNLIISRFLKVGVQQSKRLVIDGVDPYEKIIESPQAMEVYRALDELWNGPLRFYGNSPSNVTEVDVSDKAILLLETTEEPTLESMLQNKGDSTIPSKANTVIYIGSMGVPKLGEEIPTAVCIIKHRGSSYVDRAPRAIVLRDNRVTFPHYQK